MRKSQELPLQFRFDYRYDFSRITVWFVDRGASGNLSSVDGDLIHALASYYMEIQSEDFLKRIPYHRIRKIQDSGEDI